MLKGCLCAVHSTPGLRVECRHAGRKELKYLGQCLWCVFHWSQHTHKHRHTHLCRLWAGEGHDSSLAYSMHYPRWAKSFSERFLSFVLCCLTARWCDFIVTLRVDRSCDKVCDVACSHVTLYWVHWSWSCDIALDRVPQVWKLCNTAQTLKLFFFTVLVIKELKILQHTLGTCSAHARHMFGICQHNWPPALIPTTTPLINIIAMSQNRGCGQLQ